MSVVPCHDFSWPGDWVRGALAEANSALCAGRWDDARVRFAAVLAEAEVPEALEGLATATWYSGNAARSFPAAERAYVVYRREGDRVGAAGMAVQLAWRHVRWSGQRAAVSGWIGRARRLLKGQRLTSVHAWLTLCRAAVALFFDDDAAWALSLGTEAVALGEALRRADLEMAGVALQGVALVGDGDIAHGLRRLDEAGAAVVAGEVTDIATMEFVACCVVDGCIRANDDDRAGHWCEQLQRLAVRRHMPGLLALRSRGAVKALIVQQDMHDARRQVAERQPRGIVEGTEHTVSERQDGEPLLQDLTPREREVLDLVSKGLTNRDISDRLVLSEHTIHRHMANIRAKLRVPTRAAAVAIARGEAMPESEPGADTRRETLFPA